MKRILKYIYFKITWKLFLDLKIQETLEKCTKCGDTITDKLLRACGGVFHVQVELIFNFRKCSLLKF